jgi:hypothetical protein
MDGNIDFLLLLQVEFQRFQVVNKRGDTIAQARAEVVGISLSLVAAAGLLVFLHPTIVTVPVGLAVVGVGTVASLFAHHVGTMFSSVSNAITGTNEGGIS